jgi:O-antigen/teichoic acid export membrane protein
MSGAVTTPVPDEQALVGQTPVPRPKRSLTSIIGRLAAANLAFIAVTVVTAPLQARALGPVGRGELAAIMVPLGLAPTILAMGLGQFAFYGASKGRRAGPLLGTVGLMFLALGLVGVALGPLVGDVVAGGRDVVHVWIVVGFALLPISLTNMLVTDVAAGQERWGLVLATRLTPALVLLVGIVGLYATDRLTTGTAALVSIAGGTLPAVFLFPQLLRDRPLRFRRSVAREAIPFGLQAWAGGLGTLLNVRVDQLLMTRLVDSRELGLYAVAVTVAGVLVNSFAIALASGTMPRFAQGGVELVARVLRATLLGVLVISIGMAVVTPIAVPLVFGSDFKAAVPIVWVLLLAGFPLAGGAVLNTAMTSFGRPIYSAYSEFVALAVTLPGLLILLPILGPIGAALVSVGAYSASFAMLVLVLRRRYGASMSSLLLVRPSDVFELWTMVEAKLPATLRERLRSRR